MSLTYNKNKSGPNIDPWRKPQVRFPESENFLSILTLTVLPDKYDSNHEIRKSSTSHFFKEVFHDLLCKKLFASQLILNPCISQIQNLCLFSQ